MLCLDTLSSCKCLCCCSKLMYICHSYTKAFAAIVLQCSAAQCDAAQKQCPAATHVAQTQHCHRQTEDRHVADIHPHCIHQVKHVSTTFCNYSPLWSSIFSMPHLIMLACLGLRLPSTESAHTMEQDFCQHQTWGNGTTKPKASHT